MNSNGAIDVGTDVIMGSSSGFLGYDIGFSSASNTQFAYTTTTGSEDIDNYSNQFTVEAWIYPISDGANNIVICKESAFEIGINGNNIQVAIFIGTWAWDVSYAVSYNQWQHVAATFDGTNIRLYVDGQLRSTFNRPGIIAKNSNPLKIGGRSTLTNTCTYPFNGYIDEVRISNSVRYSGSTYEIPTSEFINDANTLGLWHINEGTGSTFGDASSSGKNMTLVSGTWHESTNSISSNKTTINISGGTIIDAGTDQNWLIGYSLSGNASIGETMAATIEQNLVGAYGMTSNQNLMAQGASHVTGGLKTFENVGSLEISIVGPNAKNESGKAKFSTFVLDLQANSTESININSFKIHGTGTVNDVSKIENVYLYQDVNKDGVVNISGPDTLLFATGKQFSIDNGTITWTFPSTIQITAATTQRWIVYYDMNELNPPANGKTIQVALELANYINAVGVSSLQTIKPVFAGAQEFPQSAGLITITDVGSLAIQAGTSNPIASNVIPSGTDIVMMALKLTTNSAEPVLVNTIQFKCDFSGSPVGSNSRITNARLFKDANSNAVYNSGIDTELANTTIPADGNFTFTLSPAQIDSSKTENWFVVFDFAAFEGEQYRVKFLGSAYIDVEGLRTSQSITASTGQIQGGIKVVGNHITQVDGPYSNPSVWVLGQVPGSLQSVTISNNIYLTSDQTVGTIDITGSLDLRGYTLTLDAGSLTVSGGTFTPNGGTVRYAGSSSQVIADIAYDNIIVAGSGTKTLEGATDITGDLIIYSTLDVVSGSNFNINLDGDWTNLGTFYAQQNTVTFDGAGTQEIKSGTTNFYNLVVSSAGGITNSGTSTIENDLNISSGISLTNSNQLSISGDAIGGDAASTLINSAGAILNISGALLATGTLDASNGCNVVHYNGSINQDIKTPSGNQYGEIILSGAGDKTAEGSATLQIACDWTNNGSYVANSGTVVFNGTSMQTIGGSSQTTFNVMTISNAANIDLSANIAVNTNLNLGTGDIILNDNNLVLTAEGTTISSAGASGYIQANGNGYLSKALGTEIGATRAAFTYPVGDDTYYTPFTFTLNSADLTSAYLNVNLKPVKHSRLDDATSYIERYWTFTQVGISGTVNYDISYIYNDNDIVGTEDDIRAIKFSGATSFVMGDIGSINVGSNTLTLTAQSSFSDATGGDSENPLPIGLISFDGYQLNDEIILEWNTTSESNNDYFTIERSIDNANYIVIDHVNGAGNSSSILSYLFRDDKPVDGINYYRLKQTDYDGKFEYFKTIAVTYSKMYNNGLNDLELNISPNPLNKGDLTIQISGNNDLLTNKLSIYSQLGQKVYQIVMNNTMEGNKTIVIPENIFESDGIYLILIQNQAQTLSYKVIIAR